MPVVCGGSGNVGVQGDAPNYDCYGYDFAANEWSILGRYEVCSRIF